MENATYKSPQGSCTIGTPAEGTSRSSDPAEISASGAGHATTTLLYKRPIIIGPRWVLPTLAHNILVADSWPLLEEVGRLRYELYCERDKKRYTGADIERRLFVEAIDFKSLNFQIRQNGACCLAARLSWADDAGDGQLAAALAHSGIPSQELSRTTIAARMVARPNFGTGASIISLFKAMYRVGIASGAEWNVIVTRPKLVPLFERFGYRLRPGLHVDAVAGPLRTLVLSRRDKSRLLAVRSPLLSTQDEFCSASAKMPPPPE